MSGYVQREQEYYPTLDPRRLKKAFLRRTVDYASGLILHQQLRQRMHPVARQTYCPFIQPDLEFGINLLPPAAMPNMPINGTTSRFVHTSMNKHKSYVNVVRWTPEGRRLMTGSASGEFTLWNGLMYNFETILQAHESSIRSMKWARTGSFLLSGDNSGVVKYWQINMNNVKSIQVHKDAVRGISFSPSDAKFATCSDDKSVKVWSFHRSVCESTLSGHGWDVKCLDWHPYKGMLASGSKDTLIKLWDPRAGKQITSLHGHKSTVHALQWNRNGNWLLSGSRDQTVKMFDIRVMKETRNFRGHPKEVCSVSWHPIHESMFVSGGSDGSLFWWLVEREELPISSTLQAHDANIWAMDWHPLGHVLCTGSNDYATRFWTRNRPGEAEFQVREHVVGDMHDTKLDDQVVQGGQMYIPGFGSIGLLNDQQSRRSPSPQTGGTSNANTDMPGGPGVNQPGNERDVEREEMRKRRKEMFDDFFGPRRRGGGARSHHSGGQQSSARNATKRRNPLGESDDDQDPSPDAFTPKRLRTILPYQHTTPEPPSIHADDDEDEAVDPFDQYMQNIESQVGQQQSSTSGNLARSNIDVYDTADSLESFVDYLAEKNKHLVNTTVTTNSDSDEEVYRTAYMIEQQLAQKGTIKFQDQDKREIDPLKPIDHASVEYLAIEKNFYNEHSEVSAMSPAQIIALRTKNNIRIFGQDLVAPVPTFSHLQLDVPIVSVLAKHGLTTPTPVQMQTLPVGLSGRDLIGIAATGSGKTLAYLLPTFPHMMDQPELERGDGPIVLILAPTRELAIQITKEAKRLCPKSYGVRIFGLVGGAEKGEQWKTLKAGVDLLVATPGRLIEMVKNKATCLNRVSFLVLDECDRMLEQGFELQVRSVCKNIRPDRQTLLFSATFPKRVEKLAYEVTSGPVKVIVGNGLGSVNEDVEQIPVIVNNDTDKLNWLLQNLDTFRSAGSVLIFCTRKPAVDELVHVLTSHHFHVLGMHGDMLQPDRDSVLVKFRSGKHQDVLVATDIAARGLDIAQIRTVICFDPPRDSDTHTHRVGRTGRAGQKGKAYVVTTAEQHQWASQFVYILEQNGVVPPTELVTIAMNNSKFAARRRQHTRRAAGIGRGRGGNRMRGGRGASRAGAAILAHATSIRSVSHANTLMASAFVSSSKPSESATYSGFVPSASKQSCSIPESAESSTVHNDSSSPVPNPLAHSVPGSFPESTLATSTNPLLQALAKHRAKMD